MKATRIILTDPKFCCGNRRGNAVEIECDNNEVYSVHGCLLCHSNHVIGVGINHFWKIGELINQKIQEVKY